MAVAAGEIAPYFAYFDPTEGEDGTYKYVAPAAFGNSFEHAFTERSGYWIKAYADGNLTFPSAGGTYTNATYNWADVRVDNGTEEKAITDIVANGEDWLFPADEGWAYRYTPEAWVTISNNPAADEESFSSWNGVFLYANDNVTFIRRD